MGPPISVRVRAGRPPGLPDGAIGPYPRRPPRVGPRNGPSGIHGPMEDAAVVDHATRRFGDVVAVDDLSFRVPSGSILGLIGPSGSGKTTTIRMMTGSLEPTGGAISVLGEEPRRFGGGTRRRIGYMPQLFTLYPDLTARENVDFVASLFGLLLFRRRRRVEEVLRLVDLWDARSRRAGQMSGGMQRRLELACALVHEPVLALLDEPTSGVDPLLRASIWRELRRLRDAGRTLIVTTQVVSEAAECDQVALIAEGHLVALASPEQLRRKATGGDVVQLATDQPFVSMLTSRNSITFLLSVVPRTRKIFTSLRISRRGATVPRDA